MSLKYNLMRVRTRTYSIKREPDEGHLEKLIRIGPAEVSFYGTV